eukprot:m.220917 g.220917  ORF g.220917 m.220917 type:complete len:535 (+) comp15120_c0_seq3:311-1915(+)
MDEQVLTQKPESTRAGDESDVKNLLRAAATEIRSQNWEATGSALSALCCLHQLSHDSVRTIIEKDSLLWLVANQLPSIVPYKVCFKHACQLLGVAAHSSRIAKSVMKVGLDTSQLMIPSNVFVFCLQAATSIIERTPITTHLAVNLCAQLTQYCRSVPTMGDDSEIQVCKMLGTVIRCTKGERSDAQQQVWTSLLKARLHAKVLLHRRVDLAEEYASLLLSCLGSNDAILDEVVLMFGLQHTEQMFPLLSQLDTHQSFNRVAVVAILLQAQEQAPPSISALQQWIECLVEMYPRLANETAQSAWDAGLSLVTTWVANIDWRQAQQSGTVLQLTVIRALKEIKHERFQQVALIFLEYLTECQALEMQDEFNGDDKHGVQAPKEGVDVGLKVPLAVDSFQAQEKIKQKLSRSRTRSATRTHTQVKENGKLPQPAQAQLWTSRTFRRREKSLRRRLRCDFSATELENLRKGVNRWGKRWADILRAFPFAPHRSPATLRKKHEQLMKHERRKSARQRQAKKVKASHTNAHSLEKTTSL